MPLKIGTSLPSFDGATSWLNGAISSLDELRGQPVLVDFWALSCPYCLQNMPRLHQWRELYAEHGLRIVTVHLPRLESDRDEQDVRRAVEKHSIIDPVALDHEGVIGSRFETGGVWPYYFLFDARGTMRSRAAGYSGLNLLERALQRSLRLHATAQA